MFNKLAFTPPSEYVTIPDSITVSVVISVLFSKILIEFEDVMMGATVSTFMAKVSLRVSSKCCVATS